MSGEVNGRYITWAMPMECDHGHKTRITYQAGPNGWDECLCCRDEDRDAERDALKVEVERLRRGIEAYREFRQRWQNDEMNVSDQGWWDCLEAVGRWEREEGKRDAT